MPPVQAGAPAPDIRTLPRVFLANTEQATQSLNEYVHQLANTLAVITQIDMAGVGNVTPALFVSFQYRSVITPGYCTFYYDSQSIGQGQGVWFSWRGALPLVVGASVRATMASNNFACQMSTVISGYVQPSALQ